MAVSARLEPRRRMTKAARRKQLLAAAEAVFGEAGYHGATMELVAARSGVTRSLLYEHFASLDDLYIECVRAARAELDARFLDASIINQGTISADDSGGASSFQYDTDYTGSYTRATAAAIVAARRRSAEQHSSVPPAALC